MSLYLLDLWTLWAIFAVCATIVGALMKFSGFLHVGAAAFVGVGAYTAALMSTRYGADPQLALLATVPIGIAFGIGFHLLVARLSGDTLALATLAIGIVLHGIMLNAVSITSGPMGIAAIPQWPPFFGHSAVDATVFLALVLAMLAFAQKTMFGLRTCALREDEGLAAELELQPQRLRLVVWIMSSTILTVAGGLLAFQLRFIDPSSFTVRESVSILAMALLFPSLRGFGGSIGALIFIAAPELLRFIGLPADLGAELRQLLFGAALLIVVSRTPWGGVQKTSAAGGTDA